MKNTLANLFAAPVRRSLGVGVIALLLLVAAAATSSAVPSYRYLEPDFEFTLESTAPNLASAGSAAPNAPDAIAANRTWTGTISTDFELAANWTLPVTPANSLTTDTVTFSGTPPANLPEITISRSIAGLTFSTPAGGWTLSSDDTANVLSVGTSGISTIGQTSGTNTISANIALGASQDIGGGAAGGTLVISGIVSGVSGNSLTKTGGGTLTLSGDNTYSGATTASGGTLLINGDQSSASGAVLVNGAGTVLGGTGTIGGATQINSTITGGTNGAVGTLTLSSSLLFSSGSIYQVDIGGAATDLLAIGTDLNITPGAVLNFNSLSALTENSYTLATYGTWNDEMFTASGVPAGYQLIYGANSLTLSEIPEPSTWVAGILTLGVLGWTARKRVRKLGVRNAECGTVEG